MWLFCGAGFSVGRKRIARRKCICLVEMILHNFNAKTGSKFFFSSCSFDSHCLVDESHIHTHASIWIADWTKHNPKKNEKKREKKLKLSEKFFFFYFSLSASFCWFGFCMKYAQGKRKINKNQQQRMLHWKPATKRERKNCFCVSLENPPLLALVTNKAPLMKKIHRWGQISLETMHFYHHKYNF